MNKLKIFVKKIPWSFIGVIIALISVAFAIYSWVYGRQPNISFEITNEANVLDVHKPLKDLNISFQGEDIQEKNLNLRILTIRIENTGRENILQNHYDLHDIWGFQVMDGKIIEIRLMDTNSEYLKENLSPRLLKEDTVQFIKTIFEKGKFFTLEALILHTRDIGNAKLYKLNMENPYVKVLVDLFDKIVNIDFQECKIKRKWTRCTTT